MKGMKPKDIREKSVPELEAMVDAERAALYRARRDLVFRQLTDVKQLAVRRHNIARMLTIISEKKSGGDVVVVEAPVKKTTRGKAK
jgi:large subunit ribosomal protein L29